MFSFAIVVVVVVTINDTSRTKLTQLISVQIFFLFEYVSIWLEFEINYMKCCTQMFSPILYYISIGIIFEALLSAVHYWWALLQFGIGPLTKINKIKYNEKKIERFNNEFTICTRLSTFCHVRMALSVREFRRFILPIKWKFH